MVANAQIRRINGVMSGLTCTLGLLACSTEKVKPLTITLSLPQRAFSPKQPVRVTLYSERQLGARDREEACSRGSKSPACSQEREPIPMPTPYEKSIPFAALDSPIVLELENLYERERYGVAVNGQASDQCNGVGGYFEGRGKSRVINEQDLMMTQSMRGCEPNNAGP